MKTLLLHGFCESSEIWKGIKPYLEQYEVDSPNLPGFGGRDLGGCRSLEDVARSLMTQAEGDVFLIGHSLGGYVSLEILRQYGTRVKGVCLFHSTASADSQEKKLNRTKTIDFIKKNGKEHFLKQFVPSLMSDSSRKENPDLETMMGTIAATTPSEVICSYSEWMRDRPDSVELLKNSSIHVSYIMGSKDAFLEVNSLIREYENVKGNQKLVLNEVGHLGMLEKSELSGKFIGGLIQGLNDL